MLIRCLTTVAAFTLLAVAMAAASATGQVLAHETFPVTAAATTVVPPAATAQKSTSIPTLDAQDAHSFFDGLVPYAIHRGDIAGGVVVVVKDGQILFAQGYGYADVASREPVNAETTLFRPGSVSKTFTWTAVMQWVGAGKIDLDKNVDA
ncbi:MAG: serine hydrolase domain-containing protein [Rhodanobacter sp.]